LRRLQTRIGSVISAAVDAPLAVATPSGSTPHQLLRAAPAAERGQPKAPAAARTTGEVTGEVAGEVRRLAAHPDPYEIPLGDGPRRFVFRRQRVDSDAAVSVAPESTAPRGTFPLTQPPLPPRPVLQGADADKELVGLGGRWYFAERDPLEIEMGDTRASRVRFVPVDRARTVAAPVAAASEENPADEAWPVPGM
jgi:hypothetical protein